METLILGYARTPFTRFLGALSDRSPSELGAIAISEALARAQVDPAAVDEVLVGHVLAAGAGQIPARQAAISANIPMDVVAECVNKMCASGMRAITLAHQLLRSGECDVIVAAGMESMSRAPYLLPTGRRGSRMGDTELKDALLFDGLIDTWDGSHMLDFGAAMALKHGISRNEMDAWAHRSHARAVASRSVLADQEIVSVDDIDTDEGPRPGIELSDFERLPALRDATAGITAGNASPISDGAAAVVICSERFAEREGLKPLARIASFGQVAGQRPNLATLPAEAAELAMKSAGIESDQVERLEVNEAFASVAINITRMLGVDEEKVNVRGGAIAIGHPLGASGARITGSLSTQLAETGGYGVACICSAGGQGDAITLEAV